MTRLHDLPGEPVRSEELVSHKLVTPYASLHSDDPKRRQLLEDVQQDRAELADVAGQLMAPVQALQEAKEALVMTGRSLPWIALAGNVIAIAMYLGRRQRPPITLLLGLSIQILKAFPTRRSHSTQHVLRLPPP